jgi:mono/diheme cytochrome c family protein
MVEPISRTLGQWPQFSGHEMNDLIAYVNPSSPDTNKQMKSTVGDVGRGLKVFQDRCGQCHSVAGKGATIGPDLGPEHDLPLSTARFTSLMWNHAPAMLKKGRETNIPSPQLQGTEMTDLLAFLASLRYVEPAGTPVAGKQVFADRGCAACHGNSAEGTQSGPRLKTDKNPFTAVSFAAALWRHGPRMIDRAQEMGMPWPELQATDIGNLVSFLNEPAQTK